MMPERVIQATDRVQGEAVSQEQAAILPARILLIEDEAILAEMMRRMLIRWGYSVVGVLHAGEDAVSQAPRLRPDLIVMDVKLSGPMDGVEAARRIVAELPRPVVFTTGYCQSSGCDAISVAGVPYTVMSKPVLPPQLRRTIERLLGGDGDDSAS